ncbi:putative bifunctional diguanylate cyclase/phosphodiesterase [Rhizobium helianthi]|uniref:Bifunctional diguanylate cyclase/phosphodiesterase n=1 Tax=Rhizobium helianthi TaxID=1132695 RepID=A0ABW4M649_9HYPH
MTAENLPEHPLLLTELLKLGTSGSEVLDRLSTAVWIFDIDEGRVVWGNKAALDIWAADSLEDLRNRSMKHDMSPAVSRRLLQYQADFISRDANFTEMWTLYPRGVPRPLHVRFSGSRLPDGRMGMLCEGREELSSVPEAIRSADALLHTQLMISMHAQDGTTLYCNPSARANFDGKYGGLQERFVKEADYAMLLEAVNAAGEARHIAEVWTSRGRRWHELIARLCYDPISGSPSILISASDVTELKEAETLAQKLAYHDPLTGLPNRLALPQIFADLKARAVQEDSGIGLLFIDLDQFKAVNDTLGHLQGDKLLCEAARRLTELCREGDAVVRLGGDEFLLLVTWPQEDTLWLEALAKRLIERLSLAVQAERHDLMVTPSIGIASFPAQGNDLQTLMRNADLAMYEAKGAGRNRYFFYEEALSRAREDELELLSGLRDGLRQGHIIPFYQPRVCASDGKMVGVEALARWKHPVQGLIAPARFIPLAERAGLINHIGTTILEQAVKQRQIWAEGGLDLIMSVNVSLRQLCQPEFAAVVKKVLAIYDCPPDRLELELTETLFSESDPLLQANLAAVRDFGVRIAIDDFGTGYSNIARLNEMSVDCIKIDRSLISGLPRNQEMLTLVISMLNLMQVTIVAEGVETESVSDWTRQNGVHELQGYLFSPPVEPEAIEALADSQRLSGQECRSRRVAN